MYSSHSLQQSKTLNAKYGHHHEAMANTKHLLSISTIYISLFVFCEIYTILTLKSKIHLESKPCINVFG